MIEILFAWILTIYAAIRGDADYYIAAAIFALAGNINMACHKMFPGK